MSDKSSRQPALLRDASATAVGAGFLAVMVSYSGPLLVYLSAAETMGVSTQTVISWVFAISLGAGLSSIFLSLWMRMPVAMAWSAPGTVLLISIGTSLSLSEIVAAYLLVAIGLVLIGVSGLFEKLIKILPPAITNGMMAGILFGFGLRAAQGFASDPVIVALLVAAFVVLTALVPRYAILLLLGFAVLLTTLIYDVPLGDLGLTFAVPMLEMPQFSATAVASLALPLLITTLSGQYLPGVAILRANGFAVSARPILVVGGIASVAAAFFGGISIALASITAAFCASPDSHENPDRRYIAGVACGIFFCLGGIFSGTIIAFLILLPAAVIALLAGLALLPAIQKFTTEMLSGEDVQPGLLTFLFTTSGVTMFGIGSAFWGVIVGLASALVLRILRRWR